MNCCRKSPKPQCYDTKFDSFSYNIQYRYSFLNKKSPMSVDLKILAPSIVQCSHLQQMIPGLLLEMKTLWKEHAQLGRGTHHFRFGTGPSRCLGSCDWFWPIECEWSCCIVGTGECLSCLGRCLQQQLYAMKGSTNQWWWTRYVCHVYIKSFHHSHHSVDYQPLRCFLKVEENIF